jgi:predicted TIM-barrel fold metal-dependent hydrolase
MPLQDHHQIISVDDHLIEHPRVWTDRLAAKYLEDGPQIVKDENGSDLWQFEGELHAQIGLNAVAGKEQVDFGMEPLRFDDMIPGCYEPGARILDMDLDGVTAALCYPSFPGFAGRVFMQAKDKDLALACVQAWNDYSTDEWAAYAPGRLIPLAMLPVWDPQAAAAEVRRAAVKGARGVTFPENPAPLGLPSFHTDAWDPVFSALEETDLPMCLHFGSSSFTPGFAPDAPWVVAISLFATNLMWTTSDLLFSGALQRHPNLKIVLAEGGIGWLPYMVERCDYSWDRHRWYQDVDRETPPSELFRKHFYGCFIDDIHGVNSRYEIGIDRITFEVDYPHSDSNWPNTRKRATEAFKDVPDDEVQKIVELNARRLFHI